MTCVKGQGHYGLLIGSVKLGFFSGRLQPVSSNFAESSHIWQMLPRIYHVSDVLSGSRSQWQFMHQWTWSCVFLNIFDETFRIWYFRTKYKWVVNGLRILFIRLFSREIIPLFLKLLLEYTDLNGLFSPLHASPRPKWMESGWSPETQTTIFKTQTIYVLWRSVKVSVFYVVVGFLVLFCCCCWVLCVCVVFCCCCFCFVCNSYPCKMSFFSIFVLKDTQA